MMTLNGMRRAFRHSGKWILGIVTVAMLVTAFTGIGANLIGGKSLIGPNGPADQVIATVNGNPITASQFDQALTKMRQQNAMMGQPESVMNAPTEHARVLDDLINTEILLEIAQKRGITASSDDIDAARQQQMTSYSKQLNLPANASEAQVNAALQQRNIAPIDQLLPDDRLRPAVIMQKYQADLLKGTKVSDQDIRAPFHTAHVRHILISTTKHTDVQALALASHLIDKLKGGADFSTLALQYSDDPSVKKNKGDDGWITQMTQYVPEFKKAAFSLSPGETTPSPVKSAQYGYFIIQCLAAKDNLPKDFDKNKQQYASSAAQGQVNDQMQAALTDALAKAKIVVVDPQYRADRELSNAQTADTSDPTKRTADLAAAVSDYQKALPKARYSSQGEIHTGLAFAYVMQNQKDKEIAELAAAVKSAGEPQMNLQLGMLYKQKGDTKDALDQFKLASEAAYDNAGVHMVLAQIYKQMKQPDLASKEQTWVDNYNKRQKQAMASPVGAPGGSPSVSVVPGGKIKIQPPPTKK